MIPYFKKENGPILFYACNEGDILTFLKFHEKCEQRPTTLLSGNTAFDAIEVDVFLKTSNAAEQSAEQILDYDHASWGCHGELFTNTLEYTIDIKIILEQDYPHVGKP